MYQVLESDEHIRLLELLPGNEHTSITVKLVPTRLDAALQTYEAVSYVWGEETPTVDVLCDGRSFPFRQNAYDLLKRLRYVQDSRLLWMDCICINQDDATEKTGQVEKMHQVYMGAKSVLIWLGLGSDDSSMALRWASKLDGQKYIEEATFSVYGGRDQFQLKSFLFDDFERTPSSLKLMNALTALMKRPWPRRVWIQQEAALCLTNRVLCGDDEISWEHFFSIAWLLIKRRSLEWPSWVDVEMKSIEPALEAVQNIQRNRVVHLGVQNPWTANAKEPLPYADIDARYRGGNTQMLRSGVSIPFVNLASRCSGCLSTDPRDKVYALFNLSRDMQLALRFIRQSLESDCGKNTVQRPPKPDYKVSWQTAYIQAAKWCYSSVDHKVESLTLDHAGRSKQSDLELPSWVPDWRGRWDPKFIPHASWSAGAADQRQASKIVTISKSCLGPDFAPPYSFMVRKGKKTRVATEGMEITAIMIDRVVYRSPDAILEAEYLRDSANKIEDKISADLAYISQRQSTYFTGETGQQAYAGTLIAGSTHDDETSNSAYESTGFNKLQAWLDSGCPYPTKDLWYWDAMDNAESFSRHSFVITAHDTMCLAPKMVAVGDFIGILSGIRYPVALRKVGPTDSQYFELLGQAYMHRMMRGRAWSIIDEFKCKYTPGSEWEDLCYDNDAIHDADDEPCGSFPFNSRSDYRRIKRVLGKRRITLV